MRGLGVQGLGKLVSALVPAAGESRAVRASAQLQGWGTAGQGPSVHVCVVLELLRKDSTQGKVGPWPSALDGHACS